jgi:glycerol-3-phosphate acyltransferase PlsY
MMGYVAVLVASYLLGAVPTSYVVGRVFRGIDLRQHGSGNLGATNLYRVLGWKYAIPVALVDIAKGAVPVALLAPLVSASQYFALAAGLAAVAGHAVSPFVGFKGGKGVATAAGVMLALTPLTIAVLVVIWAIIVFSTGYVSLASIVAATLLPVLAWLLHPESRGLVPFDALIALAIVWLHRGNIRRLLAGTEHRFGRRAAAPPAA